jgi:hypothetical protein
LSALHRYKFAQKCRIKMSHGLKWLSCKRCVF